VLSGGGTAGHINPAIAIADELKSRVPGIDVVFVGTKNGMENTLVTRAGYPIWQLDTVGIKRRASLSNIKALIKTAKAKRKAKKLLLEYRPDAVIGTGGYVCYPIVKAASKMGIYTALHESNAVPGLAVRMLKKRVDRIFVSFDSCKDRLGVKGRSINLGNPIKSIFSDITKEQAREKLGIKGKYRYLIVSFGGSLGAKTVNSVALEVMSELSSKRSDILHIHSYGKNADEDFFKAFSDMGLDKCKNIKASEYIYDMPLCLKAADVVICRSGAMTLTEIAMAGCASVLIPSPNVTGNHQYKNAGELSSVNAAFLVDERENNYLHQALSCVKTLILNETVRYEMERNASRFAKPYACEEIVTEILNGIQNKKGGNHLC
jgi:UDP-N-acetylglucosamine--N-acetylmuramyl-(pentapeptide) pyrophosphoryl-undecaprenol N-acetylglucosamine transferase